MHKEDRVKKPAFKADQGFTANSQHERHSGQTAVLTPACKLPGTGTAFFCLLAWCLTHVDPWQMKDYEVVAGRRETLPHSNTAVKNGQERPHRLQGALFFHLPASHLDHVSCLLLIKLFSSSSCYSIPSCHHLSYACNLKLDRQRGNCFL